MRLNEFCATCFEYYRDIPQGYVIEYFMRLQEDSTKEDAKKCVEEYLESLPNPAHPDPKELRTIAELGISYVIETLTKKYSLRSADFLPCTQDLYAEAEQALVSFAREFVQLNYKRDIESRREKGIKDGNA